MKLTQLACLIGLAASFSANADFLSITVGGGVWNEAPSGDFQKTSDTSKVDVEKDLLWDSESQGYFYASLEHPVPIIPNVKIMSTKIDHTGEGDANFDFDDKTFNGNVKNDFSIEALDLIAYYEVLDNIVSLDLGLNVRSLKVDYNIDSDGGNSFPSENANKSINETIPMLYALVGVSPLPDLIISGEISYMTFDGSTASDITAKIAYTTSFFVGLEAGYRSQTYEFDDVSGHDADLAFDGVFAGAYLKF